MNEAKTTKRKKGFTLPNPNIANTKPKYLNISKEKIEYMRSQEKEKLIFSFRFLELGHEIFNLGGTCSKWSNDLFDMLKRISDITRNDFVNRLSEHYRSHTHEWKDLNYKYNFADEFLEQVECRQARISASKGGIHGFVIGNHFYVVWLDPHHNLYPDDRYGGIKKYSIPETCCGSRDIIIEELNEKIKEWEELLEQCTAPNN